MAASTETIGREFLSSLEKFDPDYCAFLSSKSVRVLFESAKKESMYDEMISAIKNTSVVAVGPRTQKELDHLEFVQHTCQRTILLSVLARCLQP